MNVELAEIRDFLAQHAPFDALPEEVLARLPRKLTLRYFRRGSRILRAGERNEQLFVVRSGAVELREAGGALWGRLEPGEVFGFSPLLTGEGALHEVTALEDSLLLLMPQEVFNDLRSRDESFGQFFSQAHEARLRSAVARLQAPERGVSFLTTQLGELIQRPPVAVQPECSIREAAQLMERERISSLLVMEGERLTGIVTDRDLRSRVLAAGLAASEPVSRVMTPDPATAQAEAYAFELLLEMAQRNVHHMPVMRDGRVLGLLTTTDLMRLQTANPVYLTGDIRKQATVEGLVAASGRLPAVLRQLIEAGASADDVGRVATAIGDALERRLLELAEAELGPPPLPYCWLVLGSQARLEQSLHSDQDNALLLAEEATAEQEAYFSELARFVSDGLNACGYPYCPGEVMATNPQWRLSLHGWQARFDDWLLRPEPEALLYSSIFFDLRGLRGELALCERLQEHVLARAQGNETFLAYLAKNALEHQPPLGFFRGFVLEKEGEHADTFDLKHRGVAPIVDLARVYALAAGTPEVNTRARLRAAARAGQLSAEGASNLRDALEFIEHVRLRHQGRQVRAGEQPDNFVPPRELSSFEKRHLKDAFRIVGSMQTALAQRFQLRFLA